MWAATNKKPSWSHMTNRHLNAVTEIENEVFPCPLSKDYFKEYLGDEILNRTRIGRVVYNYDEIVGFMTYELFKSRCDVSNIAIHPDYKRRGFGRYLLNSLKGILRPEFRYHLTAYVGDENLEAQLFFRQEQFICTKIEKDFFDDPYVMDAYKFEFYL